MIPEVDSELSVTKWYWMSAGRRCSRPFASQNSPSKEWSVEH